MEGAWIAFWHDAGLLLEVKDIGVLAGFLDPSHRSLLALQERGRIVDVRLEARG